MNRIILFLGIFMCCQQTIAAPTERRETGTEIMDIPTDMLPPASAGDPTPFFAEPTGSQEVFEKLRLLENRVSALESLLTILNDQDARLKSEGKLTIEAAEGIEIHTPVAVTVNGKKVE